MWLLRYIFPKMHKKQHLHDMWHHICVSDLRAPGRSSRWTAPVWWLGTPTTASASSSRCAPCPPPCLSGTSERRQEAWTHNLTHGLAHSHVMWPPRCADPRRLAVHFCMWSEMETKRRDEACVVHSAPTCTLVSLALMKLIVFLRKRKLSVVST